MIPRSGNGANTRSAIAPGKGALPAVRGVAAAAPHPHVDWSAHPRPGLGGGAGRVEIRLSWERSQHWPNPPLNAAPQGAVASKG